MEIMSEVMDKLDTLFIIEVVDFTNRKDDFSKEAMEIREVLHENE